MRKLAINAIFVFLLASNLTHANELNFNTINKNLKAISNEIQYEANKSGDINLLGLRASVHGPFTKPEKQQFSGLVRMTLANTAFHTATPTGITTQIVSQLDKNGTGNVRVQFNVKSHAAKALVHLSKRLQFCPLGTQDEFARFICLALHNLGNHQSVEEFGRQLQMIRTILIAGYKDKLKTAQGETKRKWQARLEMAENTMIAIQHTPRGGIFQQVAVSVRGVALGKHYPNVDLQLLASNGIISTTLQFNGIDRETYDREYAALADTLAGLSASDGSMLNQARQSLQTHVLQVLLHFL